jgi:hypothetical protein
VTGPGRTIRTGLLAFTTPADRAHVAAEVAGALAELGVQTLRVSGPGREASQLRARETDLPRELSSSPPGTEFEFTDGLIRVQERGLVWLARGTTAERLRAVHPG